MGVVLFSIGYWRLIELEKRLCVICPALFWFLLMLNSLLTIICYLQVNILFYAVINLFQYKMEPVFVYGTLKQNQPNYYHLNNTKNGCAVFRSVAVTVNKYPLVISTKFNIPFLLQNEGTGHEIRGEVYDIDPKMLEFLDDFENHPNFYKRQKTQVKLPNTDIIDCWIYFLPNYPESFLDLQYFDNYDSCGEHGLPYVTRYQRDPDDKLSFPNWKSPS